MRFLSLVVLAAAAATIFAAPRQASAAGCAGADSRPDAMTLSQYDAAVLCLLNGERAAAGLGPLAENRKLERAATDHSRSMRVHDYFGHNSARGGGFLARIKHSGYTKPAKQWLVGENLELGTKFAGTPSVIVASWMASPEHRGNILDYRFADVGIGSVRGGPEAPGVTRARITITADFGWRTG